MNPCFNKCKHFYTETTESPSIFLLYKCSKRLITFGVLSDCDKNMPNRCKDYDTIRFNVELRGAQDD